MSPRRSLLIAIVIVAVFSFLCLILPAAIASAYVSLLQPIALLLGFVLALRVASIYQKELRKSFLFLSLFLLLYMLSNIYPLWKLLYSLLGYKTVFLVLLLQVADYAMLITACIYILRVIEIKRINRYGWIFLAAMLVLCLYIVVREVPPIMSGFSVSPAVAVSRLMITIFDMAIVIMLVPVLLLYLQYLRSKAQESMTFAFIIGGLILSLISTYIFELVTGTPLEIVAEEYFQVGSVLDAIYIFGYLVMAVGLYAHRKYDEWGLKMIERALQVEHGY